VLTATLDLEEQSRFPTKSFVRGVEVEWRATRRLGVVLAPSE
jgi:hypothetical protein